MNILIVGLGSIAKKHIDAIRANGSHRIFALRSKVDATTEKGIENIYDLSQLPESIKLDFAIVATPTSLHATSIRQLLPLRIPLLIEKPVLTPDSMESGLSDEINQASILTMVGCNLRYLDSLRFIKKELDNHPERKINEVNIYCGSDLRQWRPGTDFRKSYSARPELGGGVHLDLIHEIDYACWLFGNPKVTHGLVRTVSSLAIEAIDFASYSLIYPNFCATITLNYYRPDYKRTFEIVFDNETWTVDLKANQVTRHDGSIIFSSEQTIADTYRSQINDFINKIKSGDQATECDFKCGLSTLKICCNYERFD